MRFRVVGNHSIDGVDPGGHVDIDDEARARRLVRAGHVTAAALHVCGVCGFEAKGAGGLASHARSHDSEDD